MPRPQFSLKTLLWLMACSAPVLVAAKCLDYRHASFQEVAIVVIGAGLVIAVINRLFYP